MHAGVRTASRIRSRPRSAGRCGRPSVASRVVRLPPRRPASTGKQRRSRTQPLQQLGRSVMAAAPVGRHVGYSSTVRNITMITVDRLKRSNDVGRYPLAPSQNTKKASASFLIASLSVRAQPYRLGLGPDPSAASSIA